MVICYGALNVFAQITTREIKYTITPKPIGYDSTGFKGKEIKIYIGEDIYMLPAVMPKNTPYNIVGYQRFYTKAVADLTERKLKPFVYHIHENM